MKNLSFSFLKMYRPSCLVMALVFSFSSLAFSDLRPIGSSCKEVNSTILSNTFSLEEKKAYKYLKQYFIEYSDLTQREFAKKMNIRYGTLLDWLQKYAHFIEGYENYTKAKEEEEEKIKKDLSRLYELSKTILRADLRDHFGAIYYARLLRLASHYGKKIEGYLEWKSRKNVHLSHKKYTQDEKEFFLKQLIDENLNVQQLAKKLVLDTSYIYRWIQKSPSKEKILDYLEKKDVSVKFLSYEEKIEILKKCFEKNIPVYMCANEADLSRSALTRWISDFGAQVEGYLKWRETHPEVKSGSARSPEEIKEILKEFYASGLNMRNFTYGKNFTIASLSSWNKKYGENILGKKEWAKRYPRIYKTYSDDEKKTLLGKFTEGKLSVEDFIVKHEISKKTFFRWIKKATTKKEKEQMLKNKLGRKTYTEEEKVKKLKELFKSNFKVNDFALKSGIGKNTISKWILRMGSSVEGFDEWVSQGNYRPLSSSTEQTKKRR